MSAPSVVVSFKQMGQITFAESIAVIQDGNQSIAFLCFRKNGDSGMRML